MKIDGRCHCGEITFQAEVDPDALNICHCIDCQTLSGTLTQMIFSSTSVPSAEHRLIASTFTIADRGFG
jgi:hypothetical protein